LLVGAAFCGILIQAPEAVLGPPAWAQDARPREAGTESPQTPDAQGSASSQSCSGIHCLLGWHFETRTDDPPQPARDARSAATDPRSPSAKAPEAVPVVTIAADATEIPRLQKLSAVMPKTKIKIVRMRDARDRMSSDFSVAAALEPPVGATGAKLFTEQMHILAGGSIQRLEDLDGKVVSFGPDKSPSQAAARKAFQALNIHVEETPLDVENALDGLSTGDLDAVVLLAPQPISRLRALDAPGVHLLSWPQGAPLPDGATPTTIAAASYPRLAKSGDTIRAMGVDAVLTLSAKGAKGVVAKGFLKALSRNSDALAKQGFDLVKAELPPRKDRHLASAERTQ
jgi:hypothetical protein